MADISQVTILNGTTYDLKDAAARKVRDPDPIATKTYTDVIATANTQAGAGFFYMKVRGNSYTDYWHIKTRVKATVPGNANFYTDTIFDLYGFGNTYSWYACLNRIRTTSYRPIYYNTYFRVSETGYNNGCGGWVGFSLLSATSNTSTSYKRQIVVELLAYENCTVELQDSLITPANIPNRAANTSWYSSTDTSYDNFDAFNYGLKQTGDANTTTYISYSSSQSLTTAQQTTAKTNIGITGALARYTSGAVNVTTWTSDNTHSGEGYGYRGSIAIAGVTADHFADVTFSIDDAASGNFAPICTTYSGGVYIYAADTGLTAHVLSVVCF